MNELEKIAEVVVSQKQPREHTQSPVDTQQVTCEELQEGVILETQTGGQEHEEDNIESGGNEGVFTPHQTASEGDYEEELPELQILNYETDLDTGRTARKSRENNRKNVVLRITT